MELTINFIARKFNEYNKKYFNGELVTPLFAINNAKRTLGRFTATRLYGTTQMKITISQAYQFDEKEYCDTIIHEMIHQYIFQKGIRDNNAHGIKWTAKAREINKDGWNIQNKATLKNPKLSNKGKTIYNILTFNTPNGNFAMRCANEKSEWFAWKAKRFGFTNINLIVSNNDDLFARYACCRTKMHGFYIKDDEYQQIMNSGKMTEFLFAV